MATEKVGVYRKYRGAIPKDDEGNPVPKRLWPKKRAFSWCVRWFGCDGNRYSKSFGSRKEADYFADQKQNEIHRGWADPPPTISLRDYDKEHRELMKGHLADSTLALYRKAVAAFAEVVGWDQLLSRISMRDVERFRSDRLSRGLAAATVNIDLWVLRRLFNLAIVRGYLRKGHNPCDGIRELKVCSQQPRYVRPGDFKKILGLEQKPLWRAFLATVYTTGLRLDEALNLTWHNIDIESGCVHVARKERSGYIQAWTPKDHEMRTVPLPEQLIGLLKAWQTVSPSECPYVFMGQRRWDYYRQLVETGRCKDHETLMHDVLRRFKTLCRKAGAGPYTIHDMRRSCITNWAQHLPIHVVRQLAGHSDLKTTQRYYLSVQPDDMAKARSAQGSLLGEILAVSPLTPK